MNEQSRWGVEPRMNAMEALMWRTEADPRLRSTGVLFERLDREPDRDWVRAAHDRATREFWRLRQRVVEDPLGLAAPRWVVDPDFDLDYHLRFVRLPAPGSLQQVLEHAQILHQAPFDRQRPLWEAVLVEGVLGDQAAYLLKLHHSLADGQGIVQLIEFAHSDRPEPRGRPPLPVPPPGRLTGQALARETALRAPARGVRGAVGLGSRVAGAAARAAGQPVGSVRDSVAYVRSLGQVLGPPPTPGSPLLAQRSLGRRLGTLDADLAELRGAGKAVGGTVNDAFMAAVCGGVGRYHRHHGVDLDTLTLALPVSTRRPEDPPGSNRFAGARIAGPAGIVDPGERMRLIGERVREARAEPALDFLGQLSPGLSRLPGKITGPLSAQLTSSIDVQCSNIPGLRREAYLAGARVTHTYPFGAIPGPAMMATLMSHQDRCCIGITADAAAVPDFEVMLGFLHEGLDEVLALA
ncbi:MAG TPA: wax ester/triacylglycerol synthase domain-containing protein [Solirubrobacteraceae bacterium]|jgi:WS/DGAT/MGAT family acyltransferase|nr:wax ester/triacylglycerol synthase domain-containing protein [Solirubrobacteraceae bacterium]